MHDADPGSIAASPAEGLSIPDWAKGVKCQAFSAGESTCRFCSALQLGPRMGVMAVAAW